MNKLSFSFFLFPVEVPFTDILCVRLSDSDDQNLILTINYIESLNDSRLSNTEVTFHGKAQEMTYHYEMIQNRMVHGKRIYQNSDWNISIEIAMQKSKNIQFVLKS